MKSFKKDKVEVKIFDTRAEMGEVSARETADYIRKLLKEKDEVNIIFAAAPSQDDFLSSMLKEDIDWSRVNGFHMDEYIGLDKDAPQGFGNFLDDRILKKIPLKSMHYLYPGDRNPEEVCKEYEELLKKYPTDVVFMGVGENGHIAFNDPHVAFFDDPKLVKVVDLDLACRQQQVNDGCFTSLDKVPTHAITVTIPGLLRGKRLACVVPTTRKAEAVKNALEGPVSETCPASILRKHDGAFMYVDKDAASLLSE